jgi:hypothetical protein
MLAFFTPHTRYRVLRSADELMVGEELTFLWISRDLDRYMGVAYLEATFVEKNWRVYLFDDPSPEEAEILAFPERFFAPIGTTEPAENEPLLQARRARDRAQYLELERQRMLDLAQKKLAKRKHKT